MISASLLDAFSLVLITYYTLKTFKLHRFPKYHILYTTLTLKLKWVPHIFAFSVLLFYNYVKIF